MDIPHKPSQVAVAKHEEIVWHGRAGGADGKASENVNECSFMWRIVLLSFNGPILCHMIESKQPAKTRYRLLACIPPTDICLEKIQAIGPKIGTRKISQGTLYGKNPVPASDFLPSEPANTIIPQ
jgi:hypothetical protein